MSNDVQKILKQFNNSNVFTHAAVEWGVLGKSQHRECYGPSKDVLFDLSSLTKVFATTPLILRSKNDDALESEIDFLRGFTEFKKKLIDIDSSYTSLLSHSSGLKAWLNFYTRCENELIQEPIGSIQKRHERIMGVLLRTPSLLSHKGAHSDVYSDLGFLLLGMDLEKSEKGLKGLGTLFKDFLIEQKLDNTRDVFFPGLDFFVSPPPPDAKIAACGQNNLFHKKNVFGFCQDENALSLGAECGHAGLFATLEGISMMVRMLFSSKRSFNPLERNLERYKNKKPLLGLRYGDDSVSSKFANGKSVGHYGYTGTSFWIDPASGAYHILLTNRLFDDVRQNSGIKNLRLHLYEWIHNYLKIK